MTIRETVEKKIDQYTYDKLQEMAVLEHTSVLYEFLAVYPDGTLREGAEVSPNTWWVLPDSNTPIELLWRYYSGCGCNCDWCAEWESDNRPEGYETINDFIIDCLANNEGAEYIRSQMYERLADIPYGYFDDEREKVDE